MIDQLIQFAESGNQQKIQLADGHLYQGWIIEITDNALLMSVGEDDRHAKEIWLTFDELRHAQLFYWQGQWQSFLLI